MHLSASMPTYPVGSPSSASTCSPACCIQGVQAGCALDAQVPFSCIAPREFKPGCALDAEDPFSPIVLREFKAGCALDTRYPLFPYHTQTLKLDAPLDIRCPPLSREPKAGYAPNMYPPCNMLHHPCTLSASSYGSSKPPCYSACPGRGATLCGVPG